MYFSALAMPRNFEARSRTLAQISEKACRIAQEMDENLTDVLSLMELNFSLDGFGRLCNDLGKTCEVSKLAEIPGKCVDLAKRFADEVSTDWMGLDIKQTNKESVKISLENIEPSNDKSEANIEHDDLAVSGVSNDDSECTNSNDASDQESEEKPLSEVCVCHCGSSNVIPGESKYALPEVFGCHCGSSSVIPSDRTETLQDELAPFWLQLTNSGVDSTPIDAHVDQNALVGVSKSNEGNSTLSPNDKTVETALAEVSKSLENSTSGSTDKAVETALVELNKSHEGNLTLGLSYKTVETALVELSKSHEGNSTLSSSDKAAKMALVELSKSHEGNSTLGSSDRTAETALVEVSKSREGNLALDPNGKIVETAAEADNLVNFSKPIEFGGFEDVDLKDDWEDDTDYDLILVSDFESNKKPSKKKMAAKFISRLRRSMKTPSVEVAQKPDVDSADSDWEIL